MSAKYPFSEASKLELVTCDVRLVILFEEVSDVIDCTILQGSRLKHAQDDLFRRGLSRLEWPNSKHNVHDYMQGSLAVDVAPYPIDWNDRERFVLLAGIALGVACQLQTPIRWGGDWDGDNDLRDQTFMDLGHFELVD